VQVIGLTHYDDFNERMTRDEVAEIEKRVCFIPPHNLQYRTNNIVQVIL